MVVIDGLVVYCQTALGWTETHGVLVALVLRLVRLLVMQMFGANLFYYQVVDWFGFGLHVVAWVLDGTVEAIEGEGECFVLGVQWHVETFD